MEKEQIMVPFAALEAAEARADKKDFRKTVIIIVMAVAWAITIMATTIGWLIYESQFEDIYWEQSGDGINNMNPGTQGDVWYEPAG